MAVYVLVATNTGKKKKTAREQLPESSAFHLERAHLWRLVALLLSFEQLHAFHP
jgi:hypothetical protein